MSRTTRILQEPVAERGAYQPQPPSRRVMLTIFLVAILGSALSLLAVQSGVSNGIDCLVHAWVRDHRGALLIRIARDITDLGSTAVLTILTLAAMLILLRLRGRRAALHPAIAGIVAYASIRFLKEAIGRPRPPFEDHLLEVLDPSFPSGHATGIAALLTVMTMHTLATDAPCWHRTLLVAAYLVVALSIGWTRVQLGVHYVSDVIGGLFLGIACGLLPMLLTDLLAGRPSNNSTRHSGSV